MNMCMNDIGLSMQSYAEFDKQHTAINIDSKDENCSVVMTSLKFLEVFIPFVKALVRMAGSLVNIADYIAEDSLVSIEYKV